MVGIPESLRLARAQALQLAEQPRTAPGPYRRNQRPGAELPAWTPPRPRPQPGMYAQDRAFGLDNARDQFLRGRTLGDRASGAGALAADLTGVPALVNHMRARQNRDTQSAVTEGLTGLAQGAGWSVPGRSVGALSRRAPLLGRAAEAPALEAPTRVPRAIQPQTRASDAHRPWQRSDMGQIRVDQFFPVEPKAFFKHERLASEFRRAGLGQVEDVRLGDLTATQPDVSPNFEGSIGHPQRSNRDFPQIYRTNNGVSYIDDGHHRASAHRVRGDTDMQAYVVDEGNAFSRLFGDPETAPPMGRAIQPQTRTPDGRSILPQATPRPFRRTEARSEDLREAARPPPALDASPPSPGATRGGAAVPKISAEDRALQSELCSGSCYEFAQALSDETGLPMGLVHEGRGQAPHAFVVHPQRGPIDANGPVKINGRVEMFPRGQSPANAEDVPAAREWIRRTGFVDRHGLTAPAPVPPEASAFHQTSPEAARRIRRDGFQVGQSGAASTDYETPTGVYLKPDGQRLNLGRARDVQMEVQNTARKPLVVSDRQELQRVLARDPEYAAARDAAARQEDAIGFGDERTARRLRLQFVAASQRARDAAAAALRKQGYDSLVIRADEGGVFGKTETTAVLDPASVRAPAPVPPRGPGRDTASITNDPSGQMPRLDTTPSVNDPVAMRMERARRMGFDMETPLYKGVAADVRAFDRSLAGSTSGSRAARQGEAVSFQPEIANEFADLAHRSGGLEAAPNVMPLVHRANRTGHIRLSGGEDDHEIAATLAQAFDDGFDAVKLSNYTSPGGQSGQVLFVRNPNQLRSRFAAFGPARAGESDLLAAAGAPLAASALLSRKRRK